MFDVDCEGENETEFWMGQAAECPEISNFAAFLLDATPETANCECMFKEFAHQHTAKCNRLGVQQNLRLAAVKCCLPFKHPDDQLADQKSTNRIMKATEHARVDLDNSDDDAEDESKEEEATRKDDASDNEDEDDADCDPDQDVVSQWMEVLDAIEEATDCEDNEAGSDSDGEEKDEDDAADNECCEKRSVSLDPLPENNVEGYPQESAACFTLQKRRHGEKYVRTDKYTLASLIDLCKILPEDAALPSIASVYEKEQAACRNLCSDRQQQRLD